MKRDQAVQATLDDMPDTYLQCRDLRHAWNQDGPYTTIDGGKTIQRHLTCGRCITTRTDTYSAATFEKITTTYRYPKGYTVTKMRLYLNAVREARYVRALGKGARR